MSTRYLSKHQYQSVSAVQHPPSHTEQPAAVLLARAQQLALESESLITPKPSTESMFTDISWGMWMWRMLRVAMALNIPSDKEVTSKYLHVLSLESPPSSVEQEYRL